MDKPSEERRRHPRIPVHVQARLRLVLPEQPFIPIPMYGYTKEVSQSGLQFETRQTPEEYYPVISKRKRRARVSILLPGSQEEVTLHGKVVWANFNKEQGPPTTSYGFSFEKLGRQEQEALQRCIESLSDAPPENEA